MVLTDEERKEHNKLKRLKYNQSEKGQQKNKEYREENKQKIRQREKENRENNKDKIKTIVISIYRLYTDTLNYIGSTTQSIYKRRGGHKADYKKFLNNKHHYTTSFELYKTNKYVNVELLEICDTDNRYTKEGFYMDKFECVNKSKAGQTKKEYRDSHLEQDHLSKKKYYDKNKDKLLAKIECECGVTVCKSQINRHKRSLQHLDFINQTSS